MEPKYENNQYFDKIHEEQRKSLYLGKAKIVQNGEESDYFHVFTNKISFLGSIEETFSNEKQSLYFYGDSGLLSYIVQLEKSLSKGDSSLILYGTVLPNSS